ncbi:MAG: hypothetical protein CSYNP_03733 [Syntrophus sp. SKADARSKE-3]|nr:hypothetical protein [Syntrophus sp. SKADARSKE-3]
MEQEIFADGIGSIVFKGGVMRIDLMSMTTGQRDNNDKPQLVFRQRIVMSVKGFLDSYKMFQEIIGKMEQSGLIACQAAGSGDELIDSLGGGESPATGGAEIRKTP